jgi:hypothetical protein
MISWNIYEHKAEENLWKPILITLPKQDSNPKRKVREELKK